MTGHLLLELDYSPMTFLILSHEARKPDKMQHPYFKQSWSALFWMPSDTACFWFPFWSAHIDHIYCIRVQLCFLLIYLLALYYELNHLFQPLAAGPAITSDPLVARCSM